MFIQVMAVFLNVVLQKRYKEHEDYQLQVRARGVDREVEKEGDSWG